jgi:predicted aspartyl protease
MKASARHSKIQDARFPLSFVYTSAALGRITRSSRVLVFLVITFSLSNWAIAQPSASTTLGLPLRLYNGYLVIVQGGIGHLEKRNLVIDTGAYPSLVSSHIAKELRLLGHREELRATGHNLNSEAVSLPHLRMGPIQVDDLKVMVENLTPLSLKIGIRIDAVVGFDVLAHVSFRIDYAEKKLFFGSVDPLPFAAPLRWRSGMACVDLKVNGRPAQLLLDTGAAKVFLFTKRLAWLPAHSGRVRESTSVGGNFDVREMKVESIKLAEVDLGTHDVLVSDAEEMESYPFDGLMATGGFRQIAVDFEHQLFLWQPLK